MWWDSSGYGAHTEKSSEGPALTWHFGEGAQGFFHTYFLLANPQPSPNVAHVTYLREGAGPVTRDFPMLAQSRRTIDAGEDPELLFQSFGTTVTFDQPGMAERAMYFGGPPMFLGGSASAGVTTPSTEWAVAEGATSSFFSTFLLLANPNDQAADVTLTYEPEGGAPIVTTRKLDPHARVTIDVASESPGLKAAVFGTTVTSTQPIVLERSMYWPRESWTESHNSAGFTTAGRRWGLAEGRVGGANHAKTFILVANRGNAETTVTVTFLRANGEPVVKTFDVAAGKRRTIAIAGTGSDVPELANETFGALLDSTQPIIVERSMYTDANGVTWSAGTNATGTRLQEP
jgi:hypothetical protein